MPTDPIGGGIPLAQMIQQLRRELQTSQQGSQEERLRFKVTGIELELQVAVSREAEGGGGIKFWVVNLGGKYKQADQDIHTFKLKLLPVSGEGEDLLITDRDKEKS